MQGGLADQDSYRDDSGSELDQGQEAGAFLDRTGTTIRAESARKRPRHVGDDLPDGTGRRDPGDRQVGCTTGGWGERAHSAAPVSRKLSYNYFMNKKILLINKPAGWTSFDVVAKLRNALNMCKLEAGADKKHQKVKVGHAGTLDPFATGLLIVLFGEETKNQDRYMKLDKVYEATLNLGFRSTTGDPEGEITEVECKIPDQKAVVTALEAFRGEISQTPPIYSAIKVEGQRAYKMARKGQNVQIEPRNVTIYDIKMIDYQFPLLKIMVKCSSGTYIRTLGEDIGQKLGCGAYLTQLRRTNIGKYDLENAQTIEETLKSINLEK